MEKVKNDSTLVTPIGICLNYYEQKNNIIFVYVNEERIKMYDNSKLTVMDAALKFGYPHDKLFPKRGKALNFTINGERRMIRGELGEAAVILLNDKPASINTPIIQHDMIRINESTCGQDATLSLDDLREMKNNTINFIVNDKKITCPRIVTVNGVQANGEYRIQDEDIIQQMDYYTAEQLLRFMDLDQVAEIYVNRAPASMDEPIYENFTIEVKLQEAVSLPNDDAKTISRNEIRVKVNGQAAVLSGKETYKFVDILDVYPFDLTVAHGSSVALRINGIQAEFTSPIHKGDEIAIYWE